MSHWARIFEGEPGLNRVDQVSDSRLFYALSVIEGKEKHRLIAWRVVLGIASLITFLCVALLVAAIRNDQTIGNHLGTANAQVDSVRFDRTIIRFETPDGISHSPANGVLYSDGLNEGDLVRVEYDTTDPEIVRVAGRSASMTLLPLGTTVLVVWLIGGPLLWWLRRRPAPNVELADRSDDAPDDKLDDTVNNPADSPVSTTE